MNRRGFDQVTQAPSCNEKEYTMNENLRTHSIITLSNPSTRRLRLMKTNSLIVACLLVGAVVMSLSAPTQAAGSQQPANTFSILLSGPYKQVAKGHGPDLGLTTVDLGDGSFSTTKIFRVSGLPEGNNERGSGETKKPIGNFYVQFAGSLVAYDLPGGAIAMAFMSIDLKPVPDGQGGTYLIGTAELDITEATGVYRSFVGGHNTMVDILHQLPDGSFVEHCICIISRRV
jgi:hypothetical protein